MMKLIGLLMRYGFRTVSRGPVGFRLNRAEGAMRFGCGGPPLGVAAQALRDVDRGLGSSCHVAKWRAISSNYLLMQ